MSQIIKVLQIGSEVMILRTNRPTCPAFVRYIDVKEDEIHVEWCENGETKGKTIDLTMLLTLNNWFDSILDKDGQYYCVSDIVQALERTKETGIRQQLKPEASIRSISLENLRTEFSKLDTFIDKIKDTSEEREIELQTSSSMINICTGTQNQKKSIGITYRKEETNRMSLIPTRQIVGEPTKPSRLSVVNNSYRPYQAKEKANAIVKTWKVANNPSKNSSKPEKPLNEESDLKRKSIWIAPSTSGASSRVSHSVNAQNAKIEKKGQARLSMKPVNNLGKVLEASTKKSKVIGSEKKSMINPPTTSLSTAKKSKMEQTNRDNVKEKKDVNSENVNAAAKMKYVSKRDSAAQDYLLIINDRMRSVPIERLKYNDAVISDRINVCVRKRPANKYEIADNDVNVVSVISKNSLIMHEAKLKLDLSKDVDDHLFTFDYVFDENCDNKMVYKFTVAPLVETVFNGGVGTCFAYGQTGSGKTHTMGGLLSGKVQKFEDGIYAYVTKAMLQKINKEKKENYSIKISFFELYMGRVFDLLNSRSLLKVLENKLGQIVILKLSMQPVKTIEEVFDLIKIGSALRTSGKTLLNSNSSRSHAIFQINVFRDEKNYVGKLSLVDLAGNERGEDTFSDRESRNECAEINKSLLTLKECIRGLACEANYVPFRASKLTQVLRDSFIGRNSKTCMIATISPCMKSTEYTLNTLRYAKRVKELPAGSRVESNESLQKPIHLEPVEEVNTSSEMICDDNATDVSIGLSKSDLMVVQRENKDALSDEMIHYHGTLLECQQAEEKLMEELNIYVTRLFSHAKKMHKLNQKAQHNHSICEEILNSLEDNIHRIKIDINNLDTFTVNYRYKYDEMKLFDNM